MYKRWAWLIAICGCCLAGCSLDAVPDRGNKCPSDPSEQKGISYIIKNDGELCHSDDCPDEYADSFTVGFCPVDIPDCHQNAEKEYYCMIKCPLDQAACDNKCIDSLSNHEHCGAKGNCNEETIGLNYQGKTCKFDEKCQDGECIKTPCTTGKMCNDICTDINTSRENCGECGHQCEIGEFCENGKCQNSTAVCKDNECSYQNTCVIVPEHCGPNCQDCTSIENTVSGGTNCRQSGECYVTHCADGYHIAQDERSCVINTKEECGLPTSSSVENCLKLPFDIVDCVAGKCDSKCGDTSHEYNNTCEPDDDTNCGDHNHNCNVSHGKGKCINKECQLESCETGYHKYNGECEPNTDEHCGEHDINCSSVIKNGTGSCKEAKCTATKCDNDYHLFSGTCEKDDNSHCGDHDKACPSGAICINKTCYAESCNAQTNALTCKDMKSTCRIPAKETGYRCVPFEEINSNCFVNDEGTKASCTYYLSEKRPGVTGKCIYDPSRADPLKKGWKPSGWTCECNSSTAIFELYCFIKTEDKYCCKEP